MKEINSRIRYLAFLIFWTLLIGGISSVMLYPINHFTLKIDIVFYYSLFILAFVSSGIFYHIFYSVIIFGSAENPSEKKERFWDTLSIVIFSIIVLIFGIIVYLLSGILAYGIVTFFVCLSGVYTWCLPMLDIKKLLKEREQKYNKVFIDENGHKRMWFKV
ncbi:hypothetical protein ABW02_23235 [Niallia circulans]|uniref:Uncharacterized protein n=1 Tax=Niallia circulans TaxID=1397 RepID=A0A0J1I3X2_NIACI|nr:MULTISPECIES: hypothetical protein [Bacillaceae]KAB7665676.1 hypothetical protein F9279_19545 [Bacillus sp. B1-b2]KLV20647.1 hypothetical protein ABW02_23235 [Niallia circulans]MCF2649946.1 hypothetical protein [Niallia circulans]CAI9394907.1 hypothetical protein BACSP_03952 [Bacillus sp. T2.9-1]